MSIESEDEGYKRDIDGLIERVMREPELKEKERVIEELKALRHEIEAKRLSRASVTSCTDFDKLDEQTKEELTWQQ